MRKRFLSDVRVAEFSNVGPGQYCGRMLSDLGADVVRICSPNETYSNLGEFGRLLNDKKRSITCDLRRDDGRARFRELIEGTDIFIDGFRPGVAEKLGIGPNDCMKYNSSLIYGRITGWGQRGPLYREPGHEINYAAVVGLLHPPWKNQGEPVSPLCLIGYFAGGLYFLMEVLAALYAREQLGKGQVVESAMAHSSIRIAALLRAMVSSDFIETLTGSDVIFHSPFYAVYETLDNKYMAVGAPEEKFFNRFAKKVGIPWRAPSHLQKEEWPRLREAIANKFRTRTQAEWEELFKGAEACVSPVLDWDDGRLNDYVDSMYFDVKSS